MRATGRHKIRLGERWVSYGLVRSKAAHKLRVRVGPTGVVVVQPIGRTEKEAHEFLAANGSWVLEQLDRVERLRQVQRPVRRALGQILFRGQPTSVRIEASVTRATGNVVRFVEGEIVVRCGPMSRTTAVRSLEQWLRREARRSIEAHLAWITTRLRQRPRRVYVMGQRTKWGGCSRRQNLSFNWRLIQAPDPVLRYLVTHEAVHLVIPDHSAKFWLTVQSLCRETERARQWLAAHGSALLEPLGARTIAHGGGTLGIYAR